MEVHLLFKLLVLLTIGRHCHGIFYWDLFDVHGLSPYVEKHPKAGIQSTEGPVTRERKRTKAIEFTKDTEDLSINDARFAYIANAIQRKSDITFSIYFRIIKTVENAHTYFPFLSLLDSKKRHNYFSIDLESRQSFTVVEGKRIYNKVIDWSVNIEQWVKQQKSSSKTTFKLKKDTIKLGKWQTLMVRIRNENVEVWVDCIRETTGRLKEGRIGSFSYEGYLTLAQFYNQVKRQFVGMLYKPQIMVGQYSYDWHNPCFGDRNASKIVPEPRPSQYDDKKFKTFQKMTQQDSPKPVIFCTDKTGKKRRNNGDPWVVNRCYKYQCNDGKITERYQCRKCLDGGKEYKSDQEWQTADPCQTKKCVYGRTRGPFQVKCPALTCPVDEQYTPAGACCRKCRGDDCTKKQVFIKSCEKSCSDPTTFKCEAKASKGCYCPTNHALNLEGTMCIPTRECKCKVYGKIYLPGQAIRRSDCTNCVCSHGRLVCFTTC